MHEIGHSSLQKHCLLRICFSIKDRRTKADSGDFLLRTRFVTAEEWSSEDLSEHRGPEKKGCSSVYESRCGESRTWITTVTQESNDFFLETTGSTVGSSILEYSWPPGETICNAAQCSQMDHRLRLCLYKLYVSLSYAVMLVMSSRPSGLA